MLDLDFGLLSDWNGDVVRAFGAASASRGLLDVPVRSAFLVDRAGIIRGTWRYAPSEVPDLDELLAVARALS